MLSNSPAIIISIRLYFVQMKSCFVQSWEDDAMRKVNYAKRCRLRLCVLA